jgi:hypothetical protein
LQTDGRQEIVWKRTEWPTRGKRRFSKPPNRLKLPAVFADMMDVMQDKRSEARMLCADVVEARWTDKDGQTRRANALLEDISSSGACLQFEMAVPTGVNLYWSGARQEFMGQVRYCVYREIGYFVGVQFDGRSKWSEDSYKPLHLLDLQKLVKTAKKPRRGGSGEAAEHGLDG